MRSKLATYNIHVYSVSIIESIPKKVLSNLNLLCQTDIVHPELVVVPGDHSVTAQLPGLLEGRDLALQTLAQLFPRFVVPYKV